MVPPVGVNTSSTPGVNVIVLVNPSFPCKVMSITPAVGVAPPPTVVLDAM